MAEQNQILIGAIRKLGLGNRQAEFSVEEMTELLKTGVSVETLLDLVCCADLHIDFVHWRRQKMATEFCQKCKKAHPGRVCDYDDKGECSETVEVDETQKPIGEASTDKDDFGTTH